MKKSTVRITVLLFTAAMSCNAPLSALAAQSPSFARSTEEWEKLKDNKLEYDEIADLIHEYNPTVAGNNYDYKVFVDTYGNTNEEIASEYRSKASELLDNVSGGDDAASVMSDAQAELQAKQLNSQADNNTEDSTTKSLEYAKSEAQLVMSAKSAFIDYHSAKSSLETAKIKLETLNDTLAAAKTKTAAGTATEAELRTAQKNVSDQETAVRTAEETLEEKRQQLIIMFGWKSSDTPEIGEYPVVSKETVEAVNTENDIKKAAENNYTLKINSRKLENAKDSDNISVLSTTVESNEKSIAASINSAYSSLKTALMNLETAELELRNEDKNMQISETKLSAGLVTKYEYNSQKNGLEQQKQAVEAAKCSLAKAYMTYESYVGGLADAG